MGSTVNGAEEMRLIHPSSGDLVMMSFWDQAGGKKKVVHPKSAERMGWRSKALMWFPAPDFHTAIVEM